MTSTEKLTALGMVCLTILIIVIVMELRGHERPETYQSHYTPPAVCSDMDYYQAHPAACMNY